LKHTIVLTFAAAMTLLVAITMPAALAADTHSHGHAAAPPKLQLDHGKKWATDEPLRRSMLAIRDAVRGAPAPLHKATAQPAAYAELGNRVDAEVGRIVKECKLPPAADAQLHILVAELIAGSDSMKGAKDAKAGREGLVKVDGALRIYARYFDHPGFDAKAVTQH
jgi:hypothetical protein